SINPIRLEGNGLRRMSVERGPAARDGSLAICTASMRNVRGVAVGITPPAYVKAARRTPIMRPIRRRWPAASSLVAGLFPLGLAIVGADEPRPVATADRMAAIVAAVRAEEAKYRDIEYVARIVVRDLKRQDPVDPADVTTQATRRVVLQGDRIYFRNVSFD